jgi:hypothetical protein
MSQPVSLSIAFDRSLALSATIRGNARTINTPIDRNGCFGRLIDGGAYMVIIWSDKRRRTHRARHRNTLFCMVYSGAGEEIRTLDPNLGKVVLYH